MDRIIPAADLAAFRAQPQRTIWYMAVHVPASLYSTQLASGIDTYPVSALMLSQDAPVGNALAASRNMTAYIGTAEGASDKGKIRVRHAIRDTSVIPVAESACGLINYQSGDYITLMDRFEPWTIFPRFDTDASQWKVDFEGYTAQLDNFRPTIRMGPPTAGFLDGGTYNSSWVYLQTQYVGAGGGPVDVLWEAWDGQNSNAGSLGSFNNPIRMAFTENTSRGKYYSWTVTDGNGLSSISRRLAFLFDDRTQPKKVQFAEITGGIRSGGYSADITLFSDAQDITDGAEILIFEEASYAGIASAIAGNRQYSENIVFRGLVENESITINPFSHSVRFRAQTLDGAWQKTESFDAFNWQKESGASEWIEMDKPSIDKFAHNLIHNRSNLAEITDFVLGSGIMMSACVPIAQDLPRSPLWTQLRQNYHEKGIMGDIASDMQGNIFAEQDAQISGGSSLLPKAMDLAVRDRRDTVTINRPDHRDKNSITVMMSVIGPSVTAVSPVGATAPGDNTPGYFGKKREITRGLAVDTQQTLTQWSGNLRAKLNNPYPQVVVPLAGNLKIDAVPQSRVTMSLSAADNPRGISWSDETFLPYQTTIQYDGVTGTALTTIEMEKVVDGLGGSAITFPKATDITPTPTPPAPTPPPPPTTPTGQGDGFGTTYLLTQTRIGRTRDTSVSSPSWVDITGSITGTTWDMILDPWGPATTGYVIATSGVWKSTNLGLSSPTWTNVLTSATILSLVGDGRTTVDGVFKIMGSPNQENYVACFVQASGSGEGLYCLFSENGGSSWSASSIIASTGGSSDFKGAADMVPHTVGGSLRLFTVARIGGGNVRLYRSDDKGSTWDGGTLISDPDFPNQDPVGYALHCPYPDNTDGNKVLLSYHVDFGPNDHNWRIEHADGTTGTFVARATGGLMTNQHRGGLEVFTGDSTKAYAWDLDAAPDLRLSTNNGASWVTQTTDDITGQVMTAGGWPFDDQVLFAGTKTGFWISQNRGASWTGKVGDFTTAVGALSALRSMAVVWVAE